MSKRVVLMAPVILLAFAAFVALGGVVVRGLWNWLLPPLFGWHAITFWQALGLLVLGRILFGGLGLHSSGGSSMGRGLRSRLADRMAERMTERMESMTPEERERLLQRIRERWGFGPSTRESTGQ